MFLGLPLTWPLDLLLAHEIISKHTAAISEHSGDGVKMVPNHIK